MRMLFSAHPMWSHVMPMIPLARALQHAGHEVAFASAPNFDLPSEHGVPVRAVGPDWDRDPEIIRLLSEARSHTGPAHAKFMLREIFAGSAGLRCVPDLQELIADWRPDVVITEATELASASVAEQLDIPYGIMTFGTDIPIAILKALAGDVRDTLRAAAGLGADPEFDATRRYLRLNFAPPSYQPLATDVSHALRPVPFDDADRTGLPGWIDELPDRPIVYATLGTVFAHGTSLFEAIADGLRDEDVNLVITLGPRGDPTPFDGFADNLHVARFIPHSLLLPRCAAVVSHASYGTVMGCLTFGVPMLLLTLGADHFLHANRCRELDLATILTAQECVPERVREGVREMLSEPEVPRSRQALRDEIAALPGLQHAVDLVVQLAETGDPVYRSQAPSRDRRNRA